MSPIDMDNPVTDAQSKAVLLSFLFFKAATSNKEKAAAPQIPTANFSFRFSFLVSLMLARYLAELG